MMNGSLTIMGAIAAMSLVLFSVVAYRLSSVVDGIASSHITLSKDNSSLEEDFKDILQLIPLTEIQSIVDNYLKHDPQIEDTVSFIEDQKKFIAREFQRMPQLARLTSFLAENGLEINNWHAKIQDIWKTKAPFIKSDPSIATSGLSVMIQKILNTMPKDHLHKLLQRKAKYSGSFRRFLQTLKSKDFVDLCDTVEKNTVLQQHIFWARQEGIEITFALEFLKNLYVYITEDICDII
ncbi:uncharacterized protein LOC116850062 [Odontomachus brunneus]|uniref:uncharacterized protein LOC116850062 n=1 Tax=Odontomachus brunneus TaxID=486640 RepID=UPI0013F1E4FD|nr:uncharacterized protein LOC116850062 [Odontomachus brunneus]